MCLCVVCDTGMMTGGLAHFLRRTKIITEPSQAADVVPTVNTVKRQLSLTLSLPKVLAKGERLEGNVGWYEGMQRGLPESEWL